MMKRSGITSQTFDWLDEAHEPNSPRWDWGEPQAVTRPLILGSILYPNNFQRRIPDRSSPPPKTNKCIRYALSNSNSNITRIGFRVILLVGGDRTAIMMTGNIVRDG